jgi:hypothetical protein
MSPAAIDSRTRPTLLTTAASAGVLALPIGAWMIDAAMASRP